MKEQLETMQNKLSKAPAKTTDAAFEIGPGNASYFSISSSPILVQTPVSKKAIAASSTPFRPPQNTPKFIKKDPEKNCTSFPLEKNCTTTLGCAQS